MGYENTSKYPKEVVNIAIARAFDFFAILPARIHKTDTRRERNYGGYGKFRNKIYGLELRGLSGYFAKDIYLKWVYEQTIKTVDFVLKGKNVELLLELSEEHLTRAESITKLGIDTLDQKVTGELILTEPQKLVT